MKKTVQILVGIVPNKYMSLVWVLLQIVSVCYIFSVQYTAYTLLPTIQYGVRNYSFANASCGVTINIDDDLTTRIDHNLPWNQRRDRSTYMDDINDDTKVDASSHDKQGTVLSCSHIWMNSKQCKHCKTNGWGTYTTYSFEANYTYKSFDASSDPMWYVRKIDGSVRPFPGCTITYLDLQRMSVYGNSIAGPCMFCMVLTIGWILYSLPLLVMWYFGIYRNGSVSDDGNEVRIFDIAANKVILVFNSLYFIFLLIALVFRGVRDDPTCYQTCDNPNCPTTIANFRALDVKVYTGFVTSVVLCLLSITWATKGMCLCYCCRGCIEGFDELCCGNMCGSKERRKDRIVAELGGNDGLRSLIAPTVYGMLGTDMPRNREGDVEPLQQPPAGSVEHLPAPTIITTPPPVMSVQLPSGWLSQIELASGHIFFVSPAGVSQWQHPALPPGWLTQGDITTGRTFYVSPQGMFHEAMLVQPTPPR